MKMMTKMMRTSSQISKPKRKRRNPTKNRTKL